MKKALIFGLVVIFVLAAGPALADKSSPKLTLNWQSEVNPDKCDRVGAPVINVTEKVKNDVDSGTAGNYWAFDNYERQIKVWKTPISGIFCSIVRYEGKFKGVGGQTSPGGTGILLGNERGEFKGGYRATIGGSLLLNPTWPTHGSVGTIDYQCDINHNCPGYVSWPAQYFGPGYSFDQPWWGWIYHGDDDSGTWINAITGNFGDILGHPDNSNESEEND